jgi:hypothetical protein
MLRAIIRVATPREIPTIEMTEIKEKKRESFLEKVNLLDIYRGNSIRIV